MTIQSQEHHKAPKIKAEALADHMLRLEELTRECHRKTTTYWHHLDRGPDKLSELEDEIAGLIATCVSAIICDEHEEASTNDTRIFVAPNFRGIRGDLQKLSSSIAPSDSGGTPENLKYWEYTERYGRLAENGRLLTCGDEKTGFFMPVAFWAYKLYERKLEFRIGAENHAVKLSGFSGWTARHGFIQHDQLQDSGEQDKEPHCQPVFGFHITKNGRIITQNSENQQTPGAPQFEAGMLQFDLQNDRDGREVQPYKVTDTFNDSLFDGTNAFRKGNQVVSLLKSSGDYSPSMPMVEGADSGFEKAVAKILFSYFFFSNFNELPGAGTSKDHLAWAVGLLKDAIIDAPSAEGEHWKTHLEEIVGVAGEQPGLVDSTDRPPSLEALALRFLARYDKQYSAAGSTDRVLTFTHYYAFLLNPVIDFLGDANSSGNSALGTLNVYTNLPLPPALIGIIRKTLESIYQLQRDIQQWEEATIEGELEGTEQVLSAWSHELSGELSSIERRIQAPSESKIFQQWGSILKTNTPFDIVFPKELVQSQLRFLGIWLHKHAGIERFVKGTPTVDVFFKGLLDSAIELAAPKVCKHFAIKSIDGLTYLESELETVKMWTASQVSSSIKSSFVFSEPVDAAKVNFPAVAVTRMFYAAFFNALKHIWKESPAARQNLHINVNVSDNEAGEVVLSITNSFLTDPKLTIGKDNGTRQTLLALGAPFKVNKQNLIFRTDTGNSKLWHTQVSLAAVYGANQNSLKQWIKKPG